MSAHAPIAGPCAWLGQDMVRSSRWIRDLRPADIREIDAALAAVERRALAWHDDQACGFPPAGPGGAAVGHPRGAGERLRHGETARPSRRTLQRGPAPQALLWPRQQSRHAGLPEPPRRADAPHPRRGRRCRQALRADRARAHGRRQAVPVVLCPHPHQRRAALPHRPHGRRGPAVRAPGGQGRRQHHLQLGVGDERDAEAPTRPRRPALRALLPQPSRRGGRDRRGRLRAAGVRRPRRPLHQPLLAHLYRGGTDGCRRAEADAMPRRRPSTCCWRSPRSSPSR